MGGLDGIIFGSRLWPADWAQRDPCFVTDSQVLSHPAWRNSVNKNFVKWPPPRQEEINGRMHDNQWKDSTLKTFPWFFWVWTRNSQFSEKTRIFYSFSFSLSLWNKAVWVQGWTAFMSGLKHVSFHIAFPWNCTPEP